MQGFFEKVWLLRKEAEWCFLRPKAYKSTPMGEKTSNKRNILCHILRNFLM